MDLRKVQLTGGSSITVTLPKPWVDKSKIRPGDVIGCLEQSDGSLAIYPSIKGERDLQQYEVETDGADQSYLFRKIVSAYLMGYDVIRLSSKRPLTAETRRTIRSAVRRIVGLEIVDEQTSSISVQDFLNPREFHMEKAVRRMGLLTQAMQEEALASLHKPHQDLLRSEEDRDVEVDRLYWLVNKQYHAILRDSHYATTMGINANQALNFLLVARLLERTADHADRIAQETVQLSGGKISAAFLDRLEKHGRQATESFQNALQTFFRKDGKRANEIIEASRRLLENQRKFIRDASEFGGETVAHLVFIIESIGRTAAYAADVCEVTINHVVASE